MDNQQKRRCERVNLARGLPMFTTSEPQALANEKAELAALEQKAFYNTGGSIADCGTGCSLFLNHFWSGNNRNGAEFYHRTYANV